MTPATFPQPLSVQDRFPSHKHPACVRAINTSYRQPTDEHGVFGGVQRFSAHGCRLHICVAFLLQRGVWFMGCWASICCRRCALSTPLKINTAGVADWPFWSGKRKRTGWRAFRLLSFPCQICGGERVAWCSGLLSVIGIWRVGIWRRTYGCEVESSGGLGEQHRSCEAAR